MCLFLKSRIVLAAALLCFMAAGSASFGQVTVDKTVASVSDGVRTELILYSDLIWDLALQPNVPLDPPRNEDLQRALESLVNQRIFALEADRLPRPAPTESEIDTEIKLILARFPSSGAFAARLKQVGFSSVKDEDFQRLIARRLAIENYIDFRFRGFAVVSTDEENRYYRDTFVPDFRRRFPGVVVPAIDEKRAEIHGLLVEDKVAARIETFLDDAKRRDDIEILSETLGKP